MDELRQDVRPQPCCFLFKIYINYCFVKVLAYQKDYYYYAIILIIDLLIILINIRILHA